MATQNRNKLLPLKIVEVSKLIPRNNTMETRVKTTIQWSKPRVKRSFAFPLHLWKTCQQSWVDLVIGLPLGIHFSKIHVSRPFSCITASEYHMVSLSIKSVNASSCCTSRLQMETLIIGPATILQRSTLVLYLKEVSHTMSRFNYNLSTPEIMPISTKNIANWLWEL